METALVDFLLTNGKEGVFLILFGWLFWDTRKEGKKEKEQLMLELSKAQQLNQESQDLLKTFANKYDLINNKLDTITSAINGSNKGA